MNEVFLEIEPAMFNASDFEKYQLPMFFDKGNSSFKMIFITEEEFCKYLAELEIECNHFLSQYWIAKSQDLIEKNKFIIKVMTAMAIAKSKKENC